MLKVLKPRNTILQDSISSQFLNGMRFIAAFTVVVFHTINALGFPDYSSYFGHDMIRFASYQWLHEWYTVGYQFVMVFFILSGYFISMSVLKDISTGKWSWKKYLISRMTRLWVVLLPALILTFFWTNFQIKTFGPQTFYGVKDLGSFFANVFFLQYIHAPQYGANYPLWSLSYEFWYYILFPCMILAFVSKRWFLKLFYGLVFAALVIFLGKQVMAYFLIWLLGSLIVIAKPLSRSVVNVPAALVITGFIAYKSLNLLYTAPPVPAKQFVPDFAVGLAFALLVYTVVSLFSNQTRPERFDYYEYLAGFSYTLYLVHYPVINFLSAWKGSAHWKLSDYFFIILGIVIYAWLVSRFTEKHTSKVRNWIFNLLTRWSLHFPKKQKINVKRSA